MALFLYLVILAVTLIAFKLFYKNNQDYFIKKGVKYEKPKFFAGLANMFLQKKSFPEIITGWYNDFREEKISGIFEFKRPIFIVRDPQLIKRMGVKDFDNFMDHRVVIPEDVDVLFGKSLISLQGQRWKDMRSTLSPAFTGHKMRLMYDFVANVGKQTVETLKQQISKSGEKDFEFKELAGKFTVDNIASCAFGIQVNSFSNPENDFQRIANELTDFTSTKTLFKFMGYLLIPRIMKILKISFFSKKVSQFFSDAVLDTMKIREQRGIIRHDMIHLLMQAKKGNLIHDTEEKVKEIEGFATVEESHVGKTQSKRQWDDLELAAQCFIFFFAGFDTVATAMSFMGYELACNPDVQQKLYEEIVEVEKNLDGKNLSYETLQGMQYLDQVISEVLRKWPPAPGTDRLCVKDYDLEFDGKKITIEKDISFMVPIWAIHRDPEYYPDPEKFDPERFNDENKHNIQEYTYMPFGIGPRNCIGSRFALMEVKSIFYNLLLNFKITQTEKTPVPLEFVKNPVGLKVEKGFWVGLEPR